MTIRENFSSLGLDSVATVVEGPALRSIPIFRADIVFLDPPYELEREYALAMDLLAAAPPSLVVAQHSVRFAMKAEYGALKRIREVRQGDNVLSFYEG